MLPKLFLLVVLVLIIPLYSVIDAINDVQSNDEKEYEADVVVNRGEKRYVERFGNDTIDEDDDGVIVLDPGNETFVVANTTARRNILLFLVDELGLDLSTYLDSNHPLGSRTTYTPNIQWLSDNGVTFQRVYSNIAVSSPGRNAILTGLGPTKLGFFNNQGNLPLNNLDYRKGNIGILQRFFKAKGYLTYGVGKILETDQDTLKTVRLSKLDFAVNATQETLCRDLGQNDFPGNPTWEACAISDELVLVDSDVASKAINFVRQVLRGRDRFFMTVGLYRPKGSYSYPTWTENQIDLTVRQSIQAQVTSSSSMLTKTFYPRWGVVNNDINTKPPELSQQETVSHHKYHHLLMIQWIDFTIGRILDALRGHGLLDETVVILTSPYSPALGERLDVGGNNAHEVSQRIPLIIRAPDYRNSFGKISHGILEITDLPPTIYDLGLIPAVRNGWATSPNDVPLDGISFKAVFDILNDGDSKKTANQNIFPVRAHAYSFIPRCTPGERSFNNQPAGSTYYGIFTSCENQSNPRRVDMMGISMRTDRYRYIEWRMAIRNRDNNYVGVVWENSGLIGRELYDHHNNNNLVAVDQSKFEIDNLAPCSSSACPVIVPKSGTDRNAESSIIMKEKNNNNNTIETLNAGRQRQLSSDTSTILPQDLPSDPELKQLVINLHLAMMQSVLVGTPVCSNHGLYDTAKEACFCVNGWIGVDCSLPTHIALGTSPTAAPTTPPPVLATGAPVGAPTRPKPPSVSPPVSGAIPIQPTLPWIETPSPTRAVTELPSFICENMGFKKRACMDRQKDCFWDGVACKNKIPIVPTTSPTKFPTSTGIEEDPEGKDLSCKSLSNTKGLCQRVGGCAFDKNVCFAPKPLACGCPDKLEFVTGYLNSQLEVFRNRCHAECKGARDIREKQTNKPRVLQMDLFFVLDMSALTTQYDPLCQASNGDTCWNTLLDWTGNVLEVLSQSTKGFYNQTLDQGLRIGFLTFSCETDRKTPVTIPVLKPTGDEDSIYATLKYMKEKLVPSGGRCPENAMNQVLAEVVLGTTSTGAINQKHAKSVILFTNGQLFNPEPAKKMAYRLRELNVATFVVAISKLKEGNIGYQKSALLKAAREWYDIAGAKNRLFTTENKGYEGLNDIVSPIVSQLVLSSQNRVSASIETRPLDELELAERNAVVSVTVIVITGLIVFGAMFIQRRRIQKFKRTKSSASPEETNLPNKQISSSTTITTTIVVSKGHDDSSSKLKPPPSVDNEFERPRRRSISASTTTT